MIEHIRAWLPLRADRRAVTILEYAIIASMITVAIATAVGVMGSSVTVPLTKIATTLAR